MPSNYNKSGVNNVSSSSSYEEAFTQNVLGVVEEFGNILPENNYYGFSLYKMYLPFLVKELQLAFKLPEPGCLGPIWNYLDAGCSIAVGAHQLATWKQNTRPWVTLLKGLMNMGSGTQLITLTTLSFPLWGGMAFAAAFGCSFAMSIDSTIAAARCHYSVNYWLKMNLNRLFLLEENIESLKNQHKITAELYAHNNSPKLKFILTKEKQRLAELEEIKANLRADILTRVVLEAQNNNQELLSILKEHSGYSNDFYILLDNIAKNRTDIKISNYINSYNNSCKEKLGLGLNANFNHIKQQCLNRDHRIKQDTKQAFKASVQSSIILGTAFAGMLLLCIPGMQIAGFAVVGIASALFIAKNARKIPAAITSITKFFKEFSETQHAVEEPVSSTSAKKRLQT